MGRSWALRGWSAAGLVTRHSVPVEVAMILGVLVGTAFGVVNGLVINQTNIQPFIVSLATMNIGRGLAKVYTGGSPISVSQDSWKVIGTGHTLGISNSVWLMLIVFVLTAVIMYRTKFGRHLYAAGDNPNAAVYSGINIKKVKFAVYVLSGTLAGIAGMMTASRLYTGTPHGR